LPSGDDRVLSFTAKKEITTRLDDIKMQLQELVNETRLKRQADSPPFPVFMPPEKKARMGNSSNGSTPVK
jgi:hypothetical protein